MLDAPHEYLDRAKEATELAAGERDPEAKEILLSISEAWLRLAEHAVQQPGSSAPSEGLLGE